MDNQTKELIAALNEDLSHEFTAIMQYLNYAASVQGLNRKTLKDLFQAEINDELGHAKYLAEKIVALGGKPVTMPAPFKQCTDVQEMLEEIYRAEKETVGRYIKHSKLADRAGHKDIQVKLEEILVDEAGHRDEIAKLLNYYPAEMEAELV